MQIIHKIAGVLDGSLADPKRCDQLGVGINRHKHPLIADLGFAIANMALFLLYVGPYFVALNVAAAEVAQPGVEQPLTARPDHFKQSQNRVAVESGEPFGAADRAALNETLNRPCRRFLAGAHRSKGRLRLGLAEGHMAGIAAPALDAALTEVPKSLAGLVLASGAGHGVSPLAFLRRKRHNLIEVQSWASSAIELAPQPVQAGSGALYVKSYGLGWWFDRDVYGVTGSDSDRDADNHAGFILPESPVPAGLSYLTPKSFLLLAIPISQGFAIQALCVVSGEFPEPRHLHGDSVTQECGQLRDDEFQLVRPAPHRNLLNLIRLNQAPDYGVNRRRQVLLRRQAERLNPSFDLERGEGLIGSAKDGTAGVGYPIHEANGSHAFVIQIRQLL